MIWCRFSITLMQAYHYFIMLFVNSLNVTVKMFKIFIGAFFLLLCRFK